MLQHCVLNAFRKVLVSSPGSLEVFREEGIWDLIFSENFFYFGPALEALSEEHCSYDEGYSPSNISNSHIKSGGVEILQMEVISFVEFAATSVGSVHNLVCSSFIAWYSLLETHDSSSYICFISC